MTILDGLMRANLILGSLVVPLVGIIAGAYYMNRPERKNDYLGVLCLVLGIVNFAIVWFVWHIIILKS
jgi:hypothetical protein